MFFLVFWLFRGFPGRPSGRVCRRGHREGSGSGRGRDFPALSRRFLILRLPSGFSRAPFPEIGVFLGKGAAPGVPWHGIVADPLPPVRILRWILEVGQDEGNSVPFYPILTNSGFSRPQNGAGSHGRVPAPLPKSPFPKKKNPATFIPKGCSSSSPLLQLRDRRKMGSFPLFLGKSILRSDPRADLLAGGKFGGEG